MSNLIQVADGLVDVGAKVYYYVVNDFREGIISRSRYGENRINICSISQCDKIPFSSDIPIKNVKEQVFIDKRKAEMYHKLKH